MAGYDPQRTRHRPRPANGTSAPVDSILDGPAEPEDAPHEASIPPEERSPSEGTPGDGAPETTSVGLPSVTTEPVASSIDLRSLPAPSSRPSPARLAAGGGALALLLALLWWRLRRRSSED